MGVSGDLNLLEQIVGSTAPLDYGGCLRALCIIRI